MVLVGQADGGDCARGGAIVLSPIAAVRPVVVVTQAAAPSGPRLSMPGDRWLTATAALRLSTRLIDEFQDGVAHAGFHNITPLHGFAFARIAQGSATTADLATHLAVSKQAAAQLTHRLVAAGYVASGPHPTDHRARLLELTEQGHACMVAARQAAEHAVDQWRRELHDHGSEAVTGRRVSKG